MKYIAAATLLALAASNAALAKLPPPSEAEQQKAAEAAARLAWNSKVDNYKLCKAQDRIAEDYRQRNVKSAAGSAAVSIPTCADPGPFSNTPVEQKPLEAAGAHSPAATAAAPPNTKVPDAAIKSGTKP
jgi:hypothetical protein